MAVAAALGAAVARAAATVTVRPAANGPQHHCDLEPSLEVGTLCYHIH
jgi:hypothetical protein